MVKFTAAIFAALLFIKANTNQAQNKIQGTLIDSFSTTPLAFATIKVLEQNKSTVTDFNGFFELKNIGFPAQLKISYFGYITKFITVDSSSTEIKIELAPAAKSIKKLVVKGDPISEKRREQPLTVESMGLSAIKATPAAISMRV